VKYHGVVYLQKVQSEQSVTIMNEYEIGLSDSVISDDQR